MFNHSVSLLCLSAACKQSIMIIPDRSRAEGDFQNRDLGELHVETSGCPPQGRPARSRRDPRTPHLRLARLVRLSYRYRPWRPRHIRLVFKDLAARSERLPRNDQSHLAAALEWLCLAQDVCNGRSDAGGVSAGWNFEDGWLPGYPETTG